MGLAKCIEAVHKRCLPKMLLMEVVEGLIKNAFVMANILFNKIKVWAPTTIYVPLSVRCTLLLHFRVEI